MKTTLVLFLIIFLEGYAVLSTELLAIRQLTPFIGSGTDTVSIIIAAVLMPLAFGYFVGGNFKPLRDRNGRRESIRQRLLKNLSIAGIVLSAGLSYTFIEWFFENVRSVTNIFDRITMATLYSMIFLIYPVYLLGQTVPLITNYFAKERLPAIAGRIMFFSTLGSFAGSVLCTLVLMAFLGVHNAVIITIGSITLLAFVIAKRKVAAGPGASLAALVFALFLNSPAQMENHGIVNDNIYNLVQIEDDLLQNTRIMHLNHNTSSGINLDSTEPLFPYFKFAEEYFITPLKEGDGPPHDILVIGAGGFALGRTDTKNNYVFVDVDPDLKDIAEMLFLEEKIGENKKFSVMDARAFLAHDTKKYDLILLDIFRGPSLSPEHLVTREFFQQVRDHLKEGGAMVGNYAASMSYKDAFSQTLDNTMRAVFPNLGRQIFSPAGMQYGQIDWGNIVYYYFKKSGFSQNIYTDDLNRSFYDKPSKPPR